MIKDIQNQLKLLFEHNIVNASIKPNIRSFIILIRYLSLEFWCISLFWQIYWALI